MLSTLAKPLSRMTVLRVTNDGEKITITPDGSGTTITITPDDGTTVNGDGTVNVPGGSTVQIGDGPAITIGEDTTGRDRRH